MKRNRIIKIIPLLLFTLLFSSCNDKESLNKYVIKNITKPCEEILVTADTSKEPTTIFVHIRGIIKGECTIELKGKVRKYLSVDLKDTIDYVYKSEWYDHQITLVYQPTIGIIGDSLIVNYQIW